MSNEVKQECITTNTLFKPFMRKSSSNLTIRVPARTEQSKHILLLQCIYSSVDTELDWRSILEQKLWPVTHSQIGSEHLKTEQNIHYKNHKSSYELKTLTAVKQNLQTYLHWSLTKTETYKSHSLLPHGAKCWLNQSQKRIFCLSHERLQVSSVQHTLLKIQSRRLPVTHLSLVGQRLGWWRHILPNPRAKEP